MVIVENAPEQYREEIVFALRLVLEGCNLAVSFKEEVDVGTDLRAEVLCGEKEDESFMTKEVTDVLHYYRSPLERPIPLNRTNIDLFKEPAFFI